MKRIAKAIVGFLAKHDRLWASVELLLGRIVNQGRWYRSERARIGKHRAYLDCITKYIGFDGTVRGGPFVGMHYPEMMSSGSALAPKLFGTYEMELQETLDALVSQPYSTVVDVGCAEGYYAVGFARQDRNAVILAFDVDPVAREACRALAFANHVESRVQIGGACTSETLLGLDLGTRAIVWSDCEGYERTLFTAEVIQRLAPHDVVIELHDAIDLGVSLHLAAAFESSHKVTLIHSVDDVDKALSYSVPALVGAPIAERFLLLSEGRGGAMKWLVARGQQQETT